MDFTMEFEGIRDNLVPVRSISPEDGNFFFGYYDLMAYSPDGRRHRRDRRKYRPGHRNHQSRQNRR